MEAHMHVTRPALCGQTAVRGTAARLKPLNLATPAGWRRISAWMVWEDPLEEPRAISLVPASPAPLPRCCGLRVSAALTVAYDGPKCATPCS